MDKEIVNLLIINSLLAKGYKLSEIEGGLLNDFAEIMYKQLILPKVGVELKDKYTPTFEDWVKFNFERYNNTTFRNKQNEELIDECYLIGKYVKFKNNL